MRLAVRKFVNSTRVQSTASRILNKHQIAPTIYYTTRYILSLFGICNPHLHKILARWRCSIAGALSRGPLRFTISFHLIGSWDFKKRITQSDSLAAAPAWESANRSLPGSVLPTREPARPSNLASSFWYIGLGCEKKSGGCSSAHFRRNFRKGGTGRRC